MSWWWWFGAADEWFMPPFVALEEDNNSWCFWRLLRGKNGISQSAFDYLSINWFRDWWGWIGCGFFMDVWNDLECLLRNWKENCFLKKRSNMLCIIMYNSMYTKNKGDTYREKGILRLIILNSIYQLGMFHFYEILNVWNNIFSFCFDNYSKLESYFVLNFVVSIIVHF